MLVTFRIKDVETTLASEPSVINVRELSALTRLLHIEDMALDTDPGEFETAPVNFEVNANSLSIAAFSACFGNREDIISIVEEAQFLGRTLRIQKLSRTREITMEVSEHIALARDLMMGPELARKVLTALGQSNTAKGEITLTALRDLLQDHHIYEAFRVAQITPIFESLSFFALTDCGEQVAVVEWAS